MNIKKVIQRKGWTLERLAAEMMNKQGGKGISQAAVSQIVNGNPSLDKLKEIASVIGVPLSALVADESEELMAIVKHGEQYYSANNLVELEEIVSDIDEREKKNQEGRTRTSQMKSYHYKADCDLTPVLEKVDNKNRCINDAVREKAEREGLMK